MAEKNDPGNETNAKIAKISFQREMCTYIERARERESEREKEREKEINWRLKKGSRKTAINDPTSHSNFTIDGSRH